MREKSAYGTAYRSERVEIQPLLIYFFFYMEEGVKREDFPRIVTPPKVPTHAHLCIFA